MSAAAPQSDILQRIVATTRETVAQARARTSLEELRAMPLYAAPRRQFADALRSARNERLPALIAEVKKASPSKGVIRADFDPVAIATAYRDAGAACLSVLTDEPYFQGKLAYLEAIRTTVEGVPPLLRKDFIIDPYQVTEARAYGADAILLIVGCLSDQQLRELYDAARQEGLH